MIVAILVIYFLLSPPLVAWLVVRSIQRRADKAGVAPRDAVRRYGRWLLFPWIVYGVNILITASSPAAATTAHSLLGGAGLAGLSFVPILLIALAVRLWTRSLGHPAGNVPASATIRGWVASSMVAVIALICVSALFAYSGAVAAISGTVLLVAISLAFFQDFFRWIWHATELRDDEYGHRLRALLASMNVHVRRILVIPASVGATPNAFVSGAFARRRYLFLAERLLNELPSEDIDAVVAHEIGHLVHRHVGRLAVASVATLSSST